MKVAYLLETAKCNKGGTACGHVKKCVPCNEDCKGLSACISRDGTGKTNSLGTVHARKKFSAAFFADEISFRTGALECRDGTGIGGKNYGIKTEIERTGKKVF
ncbi:MAG: hypothetical protein NC246_13180 [Muribaculaceae bacterium]|nr:hypothetical protein [Muribaculaceae bacterium]